MLNIKTNPAQRRAMLRKGLASGKLLRFPGAFSPLVSRLIEEQRYDGIYISGAVLAADLGVPDIGMTTLTEVSQRGMQISRTTNLPAIIDADTGFGEPMSAARTIFELENHGLAGCHLEDQVNPKRCGHLDNKSVVPIKDMVKKIHAAYYARRDKNFVLIARTDARAIEGLDKAIDRAKAYVDAGADMIFPEAMANEKEFEAFRKAIDVPIMANMTEFGKSRLLTTEQMENLGLNMVIYPVTTLRIAMGAVERGLRRIKDEGTQGGLVHEMQTRQRLYELLDYEDYNQFDADLFNFELEGGWGRLYPERDDKKKKTAPGS
ncbi:MAG: methylisocitrate lyase [Alphaproteobacteria bacterium]